MKYLTIDFIKQHSRIDYDCEDQLLEMYGDSAETTMAQYLNRGKTAQDLVDSLTEEYGEIPAPIFQATLMLVDVGYIHRNPDSTVPIYLVPYTFDVLSKPYMIL